MIAGACSGRDVPIEDAGPPLGGTTPAKCKTAADRRPASAPSPRTSRAPSSIIVAALRRLRANASAEQVRSYVRGLHNFSGVQGMYDFRSGNGHSAPLLNIPRWDPATDAWFIASGVGVHK
jgi:hypothetical protein